VLVTTACSSGDTPTAPLTGIPIEVQTSFDGGVVSCSGPPTHGSPPTLYACDDSFSMKRAETLIVPAPGVLANDSVPSGASVRFEPPLPPATLIDTGGGGFTLSISGNSDVGRTLTFHYSIVVDGSVVFGTFARITLTIQ